MKAPIVSIIIVSYNTANLTEKCVKAALGSTGFAKGEIEIIVVDNNSSDNTVSLLKKKYPSIKIISSPKNLGFGAGNNQGVKIARGEYILLLNTDAFLMPDTLSRLVAVLMRDSGILSVAPRLVYADGSTQQSVGYFPTLLRVKAWMLGLDKLPLIKSLFPTPYHYYDTSRYQLNFHPDWLMGAVVLFRRAQFLRVGGFDETIFMYGEEVELFYRLHKVFKDKKNLFLSSAVATHLGSVSAKKTNTSRLLLELTGIISFYQKHHQASTWLIRLIIGTGVALRAVIYSLIPARRDQARQYFRYLGQGTVRQVQ